MARVFKPDYMLPTLAAAQEWLSTAIDSPDGAICPCCARFDKVYGRLIHLSIIKNLVSLYRHAHRCRQPWHHYAEWMSKGAYNPDVAILRHIGVINRAPIDWHPSKKSSGMYALTQRGREFVEGNARLPERLHLYHDELLYVSGDEKTISELWPEFNYHELMAA